MANKNNYYGFKLTKEQIEDLESRTFIVGGKSYNMRNLWIMANSKDFDKYPEEQAEAKKVFNALAEELGQAEGEATQPLIADTVKGGFVDYFLKAKEVHAKIAEQWKKVNEEYQNAKTDYKELKYRHGNDRYFLNQCEAMWLNAQNKYHDETERLKTTLNLEYEKLRTGLNERLVDFYKPNGKSIDNDTVALLNSGIKLSEKEINALADTYKENPTMIRLISGYCENNGIRNGVVLSLNRLATSEGVAEMTVFNKLTELSQSMFTKDGKHWGEPNNYEAIFDGKIQTIANSTLHPEDLPQVKETEDVADNKPDEGENPPPKFTAPVH